MKILHTGDWHLGHMRTDTSHTCEIIRKNLFPKLKDIDMLIIAGDIFDRPIGMGDEDIVENISYLFMELFRLCNKYNISTRILRGTFSHDGDQIPFLIHQARVGCYDDIKYFYTPSIQYEEKFDIYMGYIPDDIRFSNTEEVVDLLQSKLQESYNRTTVDYLVTHGVYDVLSLPIHNRFVYELDIISTIVDKRICSSHIHTPSSHGKLLYSGSINRLAHNEEHDKGYWIIDHDTDLCTYHVCDDTLLYTTIDLTSVSIEDMSSVDKMLHDRLDMSLYSTEMQSYAKVRCVIQEDQHHDLKSYVTTWFSKNLPTIKVTYKTKKELQDEHKYVEFINDNNLEIITRHNLHDIVADRLPDIDRVYIQELLNV